MYHTWCCKHQHFNWKVDLGPRSWRTPFVLATSLSWTSILTGGLTFISGESAEKQVQALHLCFSRETLNIIDNFGLTKGQKKDQPKIIAALKLYVDGQINEWRNLRQRTRVGESFDDFLVSLRELAKTCNFCNIQKALRDQGLQDGDIIQELLQVRDLTLDQAITKCRGLEAAKKSRMQSSVQSGHGCIGGGYQPHDGVERTALTYKETCRNCGRAEATGGKTTTPKTHTQ